MRHGHRTLAGLRVAGDTPRRAARFGLIAGIREKQLVAFTLMVAFAVIMRAELGQDSRQRARAEQN